MLFCTDLLTVLTLHRIPLHVSDAFILKVWGFPFNLKWKTQHDIVFDGIGYKNGVLFPLVFVSQLPAVWSNVNADLAVTFAV